MTGISVAAPLLQFIEEELALAPALAQLTVDAMIDGLRRPNAMALSLDERRLHFDLSETLGARASAFSAAFARELSRRVESELQEKKDGRPSAPLGDGLGTLTLMDEKQIESDIEISRAVHAIRHETDWENRELNAYTSALCGLVHVMSESNPLVAPTYAAALWDATGVVTLVPGLRSLLMRVGGEALAGQLKRAWAAAASRLDDRGVEPTSYKTLAAGHTGPLYGRSPSRMGFPRQDEPQQAAFVSEQGENEFLAPDIMPPGRSQAMGGSVMPPRPMPAVRRSTPAPRTGLRPPSGAPLPMFSLSENVAPLTSGTAGDARPDLAPLNLSADARHLALTARSPNEVLGELEAALKAHKLPTVAGASEDRRALDVPRLSTHRDDLLAAVDPGPQQSMVDLVCRLFDRLITDKHLHPAFRGPLGRLQPSVMRLALANMRLIDNMDHSVWRFMNRMAEAAASYPQASDPRLIRLHDTALSLILEISDAPRVDETLFSQMMVRLDGLMRQQLQEQIDAATGHIQTLNKVEHRDRLQRELSLRLTEQLAMLRIGPTLRRFITGQWSMVMAETIVRYGQDSERAAQAFTVVDDLVWSLQTRGHPAALKRLMEILPSLIQRLKSGMVLVGLPQADQNLILNEMMELHTAALRASFNPADSKKPLPAHAQLMSAEEIVERLRQVDDGGTPSSVSAFGNSVIDVQSMDTIPAGLLEQTGADPNQPQPLPIESLVPGMRLRLFMRGRWNRVQMLWRSDGGQHFLFAGEAAGRTHSVNSRALDRLAEEMLLLPLEETPLVERAMQRVTDDFDAPL
jgi:hypothetical protein